MIMIERKVIAFRSLPSLFPFWLWFLANSTETILLFEKVIIEFNFMSVVILKVFLPCPFGIIVLLKVGTTTGFTPLTGVMECFLVHPVLISATPPFAFPIIVCPETMDTLMVYTPIKGAWTFIHEYIIHWFHPFQGDSNHSKSVFPRTLPGGFLRSFHRYFCTTDAHN